MEEPEREVSQPGIRQTWIEATPKRRFEWLRDAWEVNTTYHLEPQEVKIEIGWIGYLSLAFTVAIIVYVLSQIIGGENMYLDEIEPNGQASQWADGSLDVKAGEQWNDSSSGSLCTYSSRFDYKYGLDNKWDYSANTCQFATIDQVAVKGPNSIHFVTYQHKRQRVLVDKVGPACDDECQAVYADWPSSASYGDSRFKTVYVATEEDEQMRRQFPDAPRTPNVHMKRPEAVGPTTCECWSYHNVFNLGIDAAEFHFTHQFASEHMSGSSQDTSSTSPTSFFLVQGADRPFKVIEKGRINTFRLDEVLGALGTCLDCQPTAPFHANSMCAGGECPGDTRPKPALRVSGLVIDVQTHYYNEYKTMPKTDAHRWISSNHEPPYAVHIFQKAENWFSLGANTGSMDLPPHKAEMDIYKYGVLIRLMSAKGTISKFDFNVLLGWIVNLKVLLSFPCLLVSFIVFNLLGERSKLLMKAKRKLVSVDNMYKSFAFSCLDADGTFKECDTNRNGFVNKEELQNRFVDILLPKLMAKHPETAEWQHREMIHKFVDKYLVRTFHPENAQGEPNIDVKMEGISYSTFMKACTFSEALDWEDLMRKTMDDGYDEDPLGRKTRQVSERLKNRTSTSKVIDYEPSAEDNRLRALGSESLK